MGRPKRVAIGRRTSAAKRIRNNRAEETAVSRELRLAMNNDRAARARELETSEQRQERLSANRETTARARQEETPEQRQERLSANREITARARQEETPEQRQERLSVNREITARARQEETPEKRQERLSANREITASARQEETPEQRQSRMSADREGTARARQEETPEQRQARRSADREGTARARQEETPDQRQARLRGKTESKPTVERWKRRAFNYDQSMDYSGHADVQIGAMSKECQYCHALKWVGEAPRMCCSNGKVNLPLITNIPEPLKSLLLLENHDSKQFVNSIRKYNSAFQMTSFGCTERVSVYQDLCPPLKFRVRSTTELVPCNLSQEKTQSFCKSTLWVINKNKLRQDAELCLV